MPYISEIWYNNENKMAEMSKKEIRKFLMQGTLTGKLATVNVTIDKVKVSYCA